MWQKLLWNSDGSPRQDVIDALSMLLQGGDRDEFSLDMVQIINDLEQEGLDRMLIIERILAELREAIAGELDHADEPWTDCESIDLISDTWD